MSEKRFSETERNCYYTSLVFDNHTQEELGTNKAVKLLNALHEENEQLKQKVDFYKYFQKDARELEKKNEQLRQQVQNAKEIAVKNDMQYQICRKEKEDFQDMCEQLRKELDNFKPVMFQDMRKGTVILYSKGDSNE